MAITQTLTQFPDAPNIALQEPEVFSERCDDTFAAQITFVSEMTELIDQINETAGDMQSNYTLAKDWATKLNTEVVIGQGYSAKQYAINAVESSIVAKAWAVQLTTPVSDGDYSAKQYALNAGTSATLAKNWATQSSGEVVAGQGYSAKYWAQVAQSSTSALPEGTINDALTSPSTAWSSQKLSSISTNADLITSDNNATATYIKELFNGI